MSEVGAPFDRYLIEAVLGEGGMGRVYRALDPRLGRKVALKVLLAGPERFGHSEAAARMIREARAAAAFNHPNVVAIYDVGVHEESPYIAMELVEGRTLRSLDAREIALPQKLAWLLDIARGLGAAHRAGLVHRDMKPENVMITHEGGVKVLDFGIARLAHDGPASEARPLTPNLPSLTAEGVMIGTPKYMPPEQLKSERLDGRADQFAWGVMAYELLSGIHPWADASGAHLVAAVLSVPARPLQEVCPELDARVASAVNRTLEKSRDARFASMEELAWAIEGTMSSPRAILPMRSVPAGSNATLATADTTQAPAIPGATVRASGAPRSGPRAVVALGVAALVAVGGTVLATGVLSRKPAPSVVAPAVQALVDATAAGPRPSRPPANPTAAAEYAAALQEEHDARLVEEGPTLERVVDADPSFAPGYVRRAALGILVQDADTARRNFRRASDLRVSLGDVDTALLDAMEPWVREPRVATEYSARMTKVSDRYPRELLAAVLAAEAYGDAEQLDRASAMYDRAIAADPTAALAYFGKGAISVHSGDIDAGSRFFDECTRLAPTNLECQSGRILLFADTGRCQEAKATARQALASTKGQPEFDESLAASAAAMHEPIDVIREYLQRANEQTQDELRRSEEARHEEQLAILTGDFRAAESLTRKWDAAIKAEKRESDDAILARLGIAEETGELTSHRAEILAAWNRSAAWLEASDERRLRLSFREYQVGLITRDELLARREAWKRAKTEEGARSGTVASAESLWRAVHMTDATTPEEAREAVTYYADAGVPALSYETAPHGQLVFGLAYARAGENAAAIPLLRDAVAMCRDLGDRFIQTQALFYLGQARELTGDVAGARDAYEQVIAAWGKAKPRSVTAAKARARLAGLATAAK